MHCETDQPQIDPDTRPSNITAPFTGHFRITADTPRGLQLLQPGSGSATAGRPHPTTERLVGGAPNQADLNLDIRRNIYDAKGREVTAKTEGQTNGDANGSTEAALAQNTKQHTCNSCGRDCSRVRYHNSKAAPVAAAGPAPGAGAAAARHDLCAMCYMEARFPSSGTAADYVKLENDKFNLIADQSSPWTDAELLLLLEALELFDEDWDSVADHVGTRAREECVLKFLQLEIEDQYVESGAGQEEQNNLGYLGQGRMPISQADNPVMSVMSFLAGLADPGVTAAAAGRSVDVMKKHLRQRLDKEADKAAPQAVNDSAEVKDENSMDVDEVAQKSTSPATVALSLTAARSSALASHAERHLTSLVSSVVNLQLQKMELKLTQFNEMEELLAAERREVERQRQRLFLDRLAFQRKVKSMEDRFAKMGLPEAGAAEQKLDFQADGLSQDMNAAQPVAADDPEFKRVEI